MFIKNTMYMNVFTKQAEDNVFNDIYTIYSKTGLKPPVKLDKTKDLKTDYRLMQVKSIAECTKGEHSAILFDLH